MGNLVPVEVKNNIGTIEDNLDVVENIHRLLLQRIPFKMEKSFLQIFVKRRNRLMMKEKRLKKHG